MGSVFEGLILHRQRPGIVDLEELAFRCTTNTTRELLNEAIACYRAGSYRASITMTWMTIVHDVLEKSRQMAIAGHKEAAKIVDEFEDRQTKLENTSDLGAIKKSLDFERTIIDIAQKKLEIIDNLQGSELRRIQFDRNRSAHPSYQKIDTVYHPTAELARMHIRCAVDYLLSVPPIQGRFVLDRVVSVIESEHFPSDLAGVREALRIAGLVRPAEALVKSIAHHSVSTLLLKHEIWQTSQKHVAVLSVLDEMSVDFEHLVLKPMLNQMIHNLGDPEARLTLKTILKIEKLQPHLDAANIKRLRSIFRKYSLADEPFCVELGLKSNMFLEDAEALVKSAPVGSIAEYFIWDVAYFAGDAEYSPPHQIIDRAATIYGKSKSFDEANKNFDLMMKDHLKPFCTETLLKFINCALSQGGDIEGSFSLERLVKVVTSRTDFSPELIKVVFGSGDTTTIADLLLT